MKCYGSTTGSNPVRQGSIPCTPANLDQNGSKIMRMQKFLDWSLDNPQTSRQEWVKKFEKMGWNERAKFSTWFCNNQDHPTAKTFSTILNSPATIHPEMWEE